MLKGTLNNKYIINNYALNFQGNINSARTERKNVKIKFGEIIIMREWTDKTYVGMNDTKTLNIKSLNKYLLLLIT